MLTESESNHGLCFTHIIPDAARHLQTVKSRMRSFVSLPAPRPRTLKVFATWLIKNKPLYNKEVAFVQQSSDLITLAEGQERGWVCIYLRSKLFVT